VADDGRVTLDSWVALDAVVALARAFVTGRRSRFMVDVRDLPSLPPIEVWRELWATVDAAAGWLAVIVSPTQLCHDTRLQLAMLTWGERFRVVDSPERASNWERDGG
jgi:hypothetical protein